MDEALLSLHAHDRDGRHWSTEDDATLRRLAGKVEREQIAGMLHRTPEAVRKRAQRLGIDCGCKAPTLMVCPRCGQWRTVLRGGICRVCHKRETRESLLQRERRLMYQVDDRYHRMAIERRHDAAMSEPGDRQLDPVELERALCERLERENSRLRRRCERMERAIRSAYVKDV